MSGIEERILETLAEGVILCSVAPDGVTTLERANRAACDLLGLDQASLRSMSAGAIDQEL
jgi:PAS domain-containing protein